MVIFIWDDGRWLYDFEYTYRLTGDPTPYVRVDLDRLYDYKDLTPTQIKACEEALNG